jgi:hypothetical protein
MPRAASSSWTLATQACAWPYLAGISAQREEVEFLARTDFSPSNIHEKLSGSSWRAQKTP